LPYELYTDAATGNKDPKEAVKSGGLGAILAQRWPEDNKLRVIAFASRQLRKHEKNYTPLMAECLAIYWAIEHFHIYLYGGPAFKVFTDHKPAEAWNKDKPINNRTVDDLRNRLLNYTFTVEYKPGKDMGGPDYLSRIYEEEINQKNEKARDIISAIDTPTPNDEEDDDTDDTDYLTAPYEDLGCTSDEMRTAQQAENGIRELLLMKEGKLLPTAANEWTKAAKLTEYEVVDGLLYHAKDEYLRLVAPRIFVPKILELAHDNRLSGHRGYKKTCDRIRKSFVWPSMKRDIRNYIKKCHKCQMTSQKTDKGTKTPLQPLPPAVKANERVHLDLMGPLKSSRANKYIIVMTDAFSKFVMLDAIKEKTAQAVAKSFFNKWISTFSTPDFIITDNGREFDNQVIKILTNEFEIGHIKTTSYHPQTNSQCERFNRTLLGYLRNYVGEDTLNWEDQLKYAQISYNTQIHASTGQCPHFLMFLEDPQLPFSTLTKRTTDDSWPQTDLNKLHKIYRDVADKLGNSMAQMRQYYDRKTSMKAFRKGDLVLKLRQTHGPDENKKLLPIWTGPFVVTNVNRETKNLLLMDRPDGTVSNATYDQVIHYHARAPYDYKKGFLARGGNGRTKEIGTQTEQMDQPITIDGGRVYEGPSNSGTDPDSGHGPDVGSPTGLTPCTAPDLEPQEPEHQPGPSRTRTDETTPEPERTTTEEDESDIELDLSIGSDTDDEDGDDPRPAQAEQELLTRLPSSDSEISFRLPKPRQPNTAMAKRTQYRDYVMDGTFDLEPKRLAERLREDGITGKTLLGSQVFRKESLLNAATRKITTFATGKEAKPQHFCRVYFEDRPEPMDTSNTYPEEHEPMDLDFDTYNDQDEDCDISMQDDQDPRAESSTQSAGHTRVQDKPDKLRSKTKTATRGKDIAADKRHRRAIKEKLLESIPHKRSGARTRSQGESENLELTDQLLRELRKKKKQLQLLRK
jgi:hypothetical protein